MNCVREEGLTLPERKRDSEKGKGYLAHKNPPPSPGPPYESRHGPTVGSYGVAVSYEQGTPAQGGDVHAEEKGNSKRTT